MTIDPTIRKSNLPWRVRGYRSGDEAQLVELFSRSFGKEITAEHWRWKLKGLPSPIENVWMALDKEIPIFQYAGIPLQFNFPGGVETVLISVDTMTDPAYRRRGLLTNVASTVYDSWRNAGVSMIVGLPNDKWGSRTNALGWEFLFPLQWLTYPLRPERILARAAHLPLMDWYDAIGRLWFNLLKYRMPANPSIQIHQIQSTEASFDDLWTRCSSDFEISIVRDSRWVNWRFLAPPSLSYRLLKAERDQVNCGYLAYRIVDDRGLKVGLISEILTRRSETTVFHSLLNAAFKRFYSAGVERVSTLAVPGNWLYKAFNKAGFLKYRNAFSVAYRPLREDLLPANLTNPESWFISGADFDVI